MNKLNSLRTRVLAARASIAIDGPAGSGKSTVGKGMGESLGVPAVDTGLMYRAVTLQALRNDVDPADGAAVADLARAMQFDLGAAETPLLVGGAPPGNALRSPEVDAHVSAVSAHPEVRRILVERQRELAARGAVVMIGRDIGTVVLPSADVKLWVTASPETRARRRMAEGLASGTIALDEVLAALLRRDRLDSTRPVSPLIRADDAIVVETDGTTPAEAVQRALLAVAERI